MTEQGTELVTPPGTSCALLIDGSLGAGVLLPGVAYRVAEIREHWEPSPEIGGEPKVSTVIRFDPAPIPEAAGLRERIREGVEGLISRGEWRENVGQRGAPRWRATVARSEVYYIIDHALVAPSQPAQAGLDVERLAAALENRYRSNLGDLESSSWAEIAEAVASQYARLSGTAP